MMKLAEMREQTIDDLNKAVEATKKELFQLRMQNTLHQLDNTAQLRHARHRIAQMKTVIRQKQQQEGGK